MALRCFTRPRGLCETRPSTGTSHTSPERKVGVATLGNLYFDWPKLFYAFFDVFTLVVLSPIIPRHVKNNVHILI